MAKVQKVYTWEFKEEADSSALLVLSLQPVFVENDRGKGFFLSQINCEVLLLTYASVHIHGFWDPAHCQQREWSVGVFLTLSRCSFWRDQNVYNVWFSYIMNVDAKTFSHDSFRSTSHFIRYVVSVIERSTLRGSPSRLDLHHQVRIIDEKVRRTI